MNDENLIELLKQALLFYGDESNYKRKNDEIKSLIELDLGEQARYALDLIETLEDKNKSDQEIYDKYMELMKNDPNLKNEGNFEDLIKQLNPDVNIKNFFNDAKNIS